MKPKTTTLVKGIRYLFIKSYLTSYEVHFCSFLIIFLLYWKWFKSIFFLYFLNSYYIFQVTNLILVFKIFLFLTEQIYFKPPIRSNLRQDQNLKISLKIYFSPCYKTNVRSRLYRRYASSASFLRSVHCGKNNNFEQKLFFLTRKSPLYKPSQRQSWSVLK